MRKSSQTNLMETVNQIDDNRRSLSSLAMEEEAKKANRKVSLGSLSIMDMTSQTNFFTNETTTLHNTKRKKFKELIRLNRELKALKTLETGNDVGVSADFSVDGFDLTDRGSPKEGNLLVLPITSPHKKGVMQSIMRRNFKINQ